MQPQSNILLFNPTIAQIAGVNESIALQQLYYWHTKYSFQKWIYNSYEEWQKQFAFWSIRTIRRIFTSLEKQGLIKSKRSKSCKFYKLDEETIKKFFKNQERPTCPSRVAKVAAPYKDTKTITKNNSLSSLSKPSTGKKKVCEREDILGKVVEIWRQAVSPTLAKLELTSSRVEKTKRILEKFFSNDIKKWEEFIQTVQNSDFLMGKITNFKVSLDWILQEKNLLKVLEGNYENKTGQGDKDVFFYDGKTNIALKNVEVTADNPKWQKILEEATETFGKGTYLSWFSKTKFISCEKKILNVAASTEFTRNWLEVNYGGYLKRTWGQRFGPVNRINLVLEGTQ